MARLAGVNCLTNRFDRLRFKLLSKSWLRLNAAAVLLVLGLVCCACFLVEVASRLSGASDTDCVRKARGNGGNSVVSHDGNTSLRLSPGSAVEEPENDDEACCSLRLFNFCLVLANRLSFLLMLMQLLLLLLLELLRLSTSPRSSS